MNQNYGQVPELATQQRPEISQLLCEMQEEINSYRNSVQEVYASVNRLKNIRHPETAQNQKESAEAVTVVDILQTQRHQLRVLNSLLNESLAGLQSLV